LQLSFKHLYSLGHEQIVFFSDPSCNLKAIVAIHSTILGPALGGTRMWNYNSEEEALTDVLRLSRGMTYKASVSGLNLGGGKAVIIGDPEKDKSEALFRSYGRCIESLNGKYITAEDVNISVENIEHIFTQTDHVVGVAQNHGGSGDPAPYTAWGVFRGIEASCIKAFGNRNLKGKVVAVQGVGAVGHHLVKILLEHEAKILFTDINKQHIQKIQNDFPSAEFIAADSIYSINCDVYSPCALGATLNDQSIPQLKCKIVAGSANNQLAEDRHGQVLKERKILYAPDYLINAGGLMNVSTEYDGWNHQRSQQMVDTIFEKTLEIFDLSEEENLPTNKAADIVAERRLNAMKKIKQNQIDQHTPRPLTRRVK